MISADDVLRYVPWGALYDGTSASYQVERFAHALYSEAARSQLERLREDAPSAAGFGVSEALDGFDRLQAVPSELEAVIRRSRDDSDGVYQGDIYLDAAFDSAALLGALESGVRIVHIASHFEFRPGGERDSFLLLGDGTRLSLSDIRERDLPFDDVDLVSLSACDTAVASSSNGREIEGFAGVVHGQGAASVIATLWKVHDPSTALVMKRFYEGLAEGHTKAEALQTAMLHLLAPKREGHETGGESADAGYAHPYYWAPFLLIGNWR
jgi:CHAT domain-containing protein